MASRIASFPVEYYLRKENIMAKWITIKYAGSKCTACGLPFVIGEKANWYKSGIAFHKSKWKEVEGKFIPTGCITQEQSNEETAEPPF
jgi:hypothetical protein|tara:strand:+ start:784 stop:1047 length:264 start_codon:yes stop_codon:yes gene_type:complete